MSTAHLPAVACLLPSHELSITTCVMTHRCLDHLVPELPSVQNLLMGDGGQSVERVMSKQIRCTHTVFFPGGLTPLMAVMR